MESLLLGLRRWCETFRCARSGPLLCILQVAVYEADRWNVLTKGDSFLNYSEKIDENVTGTDMIRAQEPEVCTRSLFSIAEAATIRTILIQRSIRRRLIQGTEYSDTVVSCRLGCFLALSWEDSTWTLLKFFTGTLFAINDML